MKDKHNENAGVKCKSLELLVWKVKIVESTQATNSSIKLSMWYRTEAHTYQPPLPPTEIYFQNEQQIKGSDLVDQGAVRDRKEQEQEAQEKNLRWDREGAVSYTHLDVYKRQVSIS